MNEIQLATQAEARAIMGRDFHGPETINEIFSCDLQNNSGWIIPYTKEYLEEYKGKCILFSGCDTDKNGNRITINWFRKKFSEGRKPCFARQIAHDFSGEPFSKELTCQGQRYYLLYKTIPLKHPSREKRIALHKLATLKDNEQLEHAIIYVFGAFLHFLTTREKMYRYDYVLTKDKFGDQNIRVGHFEYQDFYIGKALPGMIFNMLGIAPSIKPLLME